MEESKPHPDLAYYIYSPHVLTRVSIKTLVSYKTFIEHLIIRLGEDWKIQASLFEQEVKQMQAHGPKHQNLCLFNQLLCAFISKAWGQEHKYAGLGEGELHRVFLEQVNERFPQQIIHNNLTFKTLTLGYSINAIELWQKFFTEDHPRQVFGPSTIRVFGKYLGPKQVEKDDKHSSTEERITSKWDSLSYEELEISQVSQIKHQLKTLPHSLSEVQILSYFAAYVDQFTLENSTRIHVFSLSEEFYSKAVMTWLTFNIKVVFSLPFNDYLTFFQALQAQKWHSSLEKPLKKLQSLLDGEWSNLIRDLTVALQDDSEVLRTFIERVRRRLQADWHQKIDLLRDNLSR